MIVVEFLRFVSLLHYQCEMVISADIHLRYVIFTSHKIFYRAVLKTNPCEIPSPFICINEVYEAIVWGKTERRDGSIELLAQNRLFLVSQGIHRELRQRIGTILCVLSQIGDQLAVTAPAR